jgi:hypothetical protein
MILTDKQIHQKTWYSARNASLGHLVFRPRVAQYSCLDRIFRFQYTRWGRRNRWKLWCAASCYANVEDFSEDVRCI